MTPSLLGVGAAALLATRHQAALLWLALVLLAATFLAVRNAFGALAVLATAAGVFAVSYFASAAVQAGFAYLAAWFLLLGGMRPVLELTHRRRRAPRAGLSDADQLARLTGVSRDVWVTAFLLVCHRRPGPRRPPAHPLRNPLTASLKRSPTPLRRDNAARRYASCYFAVIAH